MREEAGNGHEVFCMYDYHTGRVYSCDEQVEFVSCDRRTYRAYDIRLRASAMSMDQYLDCCELYVADSFVYVKKACMMRSSSTRPSLAARVHTAYDRYDAYESYAILRC